MTRTHHSTALPGESKLAERRRRMYRRLTYVGLGVLVLLLAGIVGLMRAPWLRVHTIEVTGVRTISADAVQTYAAGQLSGDYLWVFPKDNLLLLSSRGLVGALQTQFPRSGRVEVQRRWPSGLSISITERAPTARWCGVAAPSVALPVGAAVSVATSSAEALIVPPAPVSAPSAIGANCISLDITGLAYEQETPGDGTDVLPKWYGPLAGDAVEPALPTQFLTPREFASVSALADAIAGQLNVGSTTAVAVDEEGNGRVAFPDGFSVLFDATADAGTTMDHLSTALASPIFAGRTPADFHYLDLRFGDHLYYKLTATSTDKK